MAINDVIKQILGRQLSQKEIESANRNEKKDIKFLGTLRAKIEYSKDGEDLVKRVVKYESMITSDVSYPGIKHEGIYDTKIVTGVYTKEGKLIQKTIQAGMWKGGTRTSVKSYNPAGSIVGETKHY